MHPVYKSFRTALFSIALNANFAGYTTAAVTHRFDSHSLVSSTQVSEVSKTLASGSVSPVKRLIASASGTSGVLTSGQALAPNQSLTSPNGQYSLVCQSDGNLVLYDNLRSSALWASQTPGKTVSECVMQSDGNLVVYGSAAAIWASNTAGNGGADLQVQDDGNVVIYTTSGKALWATGTAVGIVNLDSSTYYTTNIPLDAAAELKTLANQKSIEDFDSITFAPNGGWVIIKANDYVTGGNFPADAANELSALKQQKSNIRCVAFAPSGGWVIISGKNGYNTGGNFPADAANRLLALNQQGLRINSIAFTPKGEWVILANNNDGTTFATNAYWSQNLPQDVVQGIQQVYSNSTNIENHEIDHIAFAPDGKWVITLNNHRNSYYSPGISPGLSNLINKDTYNSVVPFALAFTPDNGWVIEEIYINYGF